MLTGKPEILQMFGKWHIGKYGVMINGAITLLSAALMLFPQTFLIGNFLMAAGILLIICLQLLYKSPAGAVIELPFLLLNLLIVYLGYPL